MISYEFFYREEVSVDSVSDLKCDLFVSAFNKSERVKLIFDRISAKNKYWLYFKEYQLSDSDIDLGAGYSCNQQSESDQIIEFFEHINSSMGCSVKDLLICFDITGFMRPQLLFLIRYLKEVGVKKAFAIYSEPNRYSENERTTFSKGNIIEIRQVHGYEGFHNHNTTNDLLVIGCGYDDKLISSVADEKENAKKLQLIGFPSLLPDMYQQNILNVSKAAESLGGDSSLRPIFASANDPFKTASALSRAIISFEKNQGEISNLYLSPLSTKAQALGFAIFYIYEKMGTNTSIIFPFAEYYQQETSKGCSRVNLYTLEFEV